jgi:hypothetical protein
MNSSNPANEAMNPFTDESSPESDPAMTVENQFLMLEKKCHDSTRAKDQRTLVGA